MKKSLVTALLMAAMLVFNASCGQEGEGNLINDESSGEDSPLVMEESSVKSTADDDNHDVLPEADTLLNQGDCVKAMEELRAAEKLDVTGKISEKIEFLKDHVKCTAKYIVVDDENQYLDHTYEYDASGNLIKETKYDPLEWTEYTYDLDGKLLTETRYSDREGIETQYINTYDGFGNMIKREHNHYTDGVVNPDYSDWHEYEYDSDGRVIIRRFGDWDGLSPVFDRFEYDEKGNLIKDIDTSDTNVPNYWTEYEYDSSGNKIKEGTYDGDGNRGWWREFTYDADGNCTVAKEYESDGTLKKGWNEFEYDEYGNQTKRIQHDNADGSVDQWYEYEHDAFGNVIKETRYLTEYDPNGYVDRCDQYAYDYIYIK